MKIKKLLALLLSISMVLSCAPGAVFAESHTDHTGYTAWTSTTTVPNTTGKYYLTNDVTVSAAKTVAAGANVELCLNGHSISAASSGYRLYLVRGTLKITDCSDTPGTVSGFSGVSNGGAFYIDARGALTIEDITISGNTATTNGGAFYAVSDSSVTIDSATVSGNTAQKGGALYFTGSSTAAASRLSVSGSSFTGNTASSEGGAFYMTGVNSSNGLTVTAEMTDTVISGNTGVNGSAITMYGCSLTLEDAVVTENNSTSTSGYGAVHMARNNSTMAVVTVKGATKITGNTNKGTTPQNVYLRQNGSDDAVQYAYLVPDGLTAGAQIGVTLDTTATGGITADRYNDYDGAGRYITSADAVIPAGTENYFSSDKIGYTPELLGGRIYLGVSHVHDFYGNSGSDDAVLWTKTDSLPAAAGSYYLAQDVELDSVYTVSADISICLNGHNITAVGQAHRVIVVASGNTLNITDCSSEPGTISGGNNKYGGGIQVQRGAVFNLYNGIISGNASTASDGGEGGAVYVQGRTVTAVNGENVYYNGGIFNMYGGKIIANEGRLGSAIHLYGFGATGAEEYEPGIVNIYGGEISGNSATTGTIYVRQYGRLNIYGGTFSDNRTSASGGVIYSAAGAEIAISGGTFTGNSAGGNGGVIWAAAGNDLTVSGAVMTGNSAVRGAAILHNNSSTLAGSLQLSDVTVKDNICLGDGAGVAEAVYFNSGTLTLSGVCIIKNNLFNGSPRDVRLSSGNSVSIGEAGLGLGSDVRLCSDVIATGYEAVTGAEEGSLSYFSVTGKTGGGLYYSAGSLYYSEHAVCGEIYEPWTEADSLPREAGRYYLTKNVTLTEEIFIPSKVVIDLNGKHVTAGENLGIIVLETGACVTLTDSVGSGYLTGGRTECGGAIYLFPGSTLLLDGITIKDNYVTRSGGAIYAKSVTEADYNNGTVTDITIRNCTFTGNTCVPDMSNYDGGVMYMGRGVHAEISDTTITGNVGKNASVVYAVGTVDGLVLENCTITGNRCSSSGSYTGAIYMIGNGLTLKGANVIKNNYYYSYNTTSSWVLSSRPANVTLQNGETATLSIEDSSADADVSIKYAKDKTSGYIGTIKGELLGTYTWSAATSYIIDVIDGGLYVLAPWTKTTSLPASGDYFLGNNVTLSANTTVTGDMTLCLHGNVVTLNNASGGITVGGDYSVIISDDAGGGIAVSTGITRSYPILGVSAGNLSIYDLGLSNITTTVPVINVTGSGALQMKNGFVKESYSQSSSIVLLNTSGEVLFDGCEFTNNTGLNGSAIRNEASSLTLRDCLIEINTDLGNTAFETGAVVLIASATFEGGNIVAGNTGGTGNADVYIKSGVGFAVKNASNDQALRLVSDSDFENERLGVILEGELLGIYQWMKNTAADVAASGSDIVLISGSYSNIVYNGKIYAPWTEAGLPASNPTASGVYGWYLTKDVMVSTYKTVSSTLNLCMNGKNVKLFGQATNGVYRTTKGTINIVNNVSGAGSFSGNGLTIESLIFTSGSSTSAANINISDVSFRDFKNCNIYGHAIVCQGGANITLTNCVFENNNIDSRSGGAAMYLTGTGTATITNCVFRNNSSMAASGGAIYAGGSRTINLSGNTFENCVTSGTGGAVYCGGETALNATGNTFTNCSSGTSGGAIGYVGSGTCNIDQNTFEGCIAGDSYYGGGVYTNVSYGMATVSRNTFNGCSAGNGGAVASAVTGSSRIGGENAQNIFEGNSSVNNSDDIYISGSATAMDFGENIVADNIFNGPINGYSVGFGGRVAATVTGTLDASAAEFGMDGSLIYGGERSTVLFDDAVVAVPDEASAGQSFGTFILSDSQIGGYTTVKADYNMWMIQMDAMLIARGDTTANVVMTQNTGSWFAGTTDGFAENTLLVIQGENLGDNAKINLTIPKGTSVDEFVFGPANVSGKGTAYVVTKGVSLPGFDPAPETSGDYDYDITSAQMTINSRLSMSFFVTTNDPAAKASFYLDDSTVAISDDYVTQEATDYGYKFTLHYLSPNSLTANIRMEITDENGSVVVTKNGFAIVDYLDALYQAYKNDNSDRAEALRLLIADLIRFGDAAQQFAGSSRELPSQGREWIAQYVRSDITAPAQNGYVLSNTVNSPAIRSGSINLNDEVDMVFNVYAGEDDIASLEYTDDGTLWTSVSNFGGTFGSMDGQNFEAFEVSRSGRLYSVKVFGIMPSQYGRVYRLTVGNNGDAQVTYSVNSYIYRMWNNSSVGDLMQKMYSYELSAVGYAALG